MENKSRISIKHKDDNNIAGLGFNDIPIGSFYRSINNSSNWIYLKVDKDNYFDFNGLGLQKGPPKGVGCREIIDVDIIIKGVSA